MRRVKTFISCRIFYDIVCKCHCSLKASRLRRLPVILDFIELPISCSLRLTRGVAGRMDCFGIENHESFHFPFTNFRISENFILWSLKSKQISFAENVQVQKVYLKAHCRCTCRIFGKKK
ncbi:hypothetical protein AB3S75_038325 [Citrus x aurantiifolia]